MLPDIVQKQYQSDIMLGAFDSIKHVCKMDFQVIILIVSVVMISFGSMLPGSVITDLLAKSSMPDNPKKRYKQVSSADTCNPQFF